MVWSFVAGAKSISCCVGKDKYVCNGAGTPQSAVFVEKLPSSGI